MQTKQDILAYLARRPRSRDTLEGIAEWWLLEQQIVRRTSEVREALAELVAEGWVVERGGRSARIRYSVNPDRLGEIASLAKQGAE